MFYDGRQPSGRRPSCFKPNLESFASPFHQGMIVTGELVAVAVTVVLVKS